MKLSLNIVRFLNHKYGCAADPASKGLDDLVDRIGRQVGAVEEVINLGERYEGIVVAKVIKCERHPNADKLSVCLIDDGKAAKSVKRNKDGLIQVVCGAPNVTSGQLVAWIPPGATVPSTVDKDPFVLKAIELRGVTSNGMIASAKELALGDDHTGILVLEPPVKPGQLFAKVAGLDDHVIDIENKMFTHRPDLFGQLGVSRELAGIQGHRFKSPSWYREDATLKKGRADSLKFSVQNELPRLVPRFTAVLIKDVRVGESPLWLKARLTSLGIRPINNIVDLTNFFMAVTAQPLHAYDYDKLGDKLIIRKPKPAETLKIIGGKSIKLQPGDIVIASAAQAVGLGGVMGGADTEVNESTKNIVLEVANFDMNTVRRTAMHHGLFTDAATRFTKNQSPRQTAAVAAKVAEEIMQLAGGRLASGLIDVRHHDVKPVTVKVGVDFINQRLGLNLTTANMKRLLENVEFKVSGSQTLVVTAPFWRTDIEIPEDIVEEVGRLYGYDHLELALPIKDLKAAERNSQLDLKQKIRNILSRAGANEVQTYSFVHESLLRKASQDSKASFHIRNAISPDLQYYRQTLLPSLLEKVHPNIKAGYDKFALFELGVGHYKGALGEDKLPLGLEQLGLVVTSKDKVAGAPYFSAQKFATYLLHELGYARVDYQPPKESTLHPSLSYYELDRSANVYADGNLVGRIGELKESVRRELKLPDNVAGFDLYLPQFKEPEANAYQPIGRFPNSEQDLTLRAPAKLSYRELTEFVWQHVNKITAEHGISISLKPLDIYRRAGSDQKQTTWRLSFQHPERTLTTEEINRLLDDLATAAKMKLKAVRI